MIGQNVKIMLDIRGLTQKDLADMIGASAGTISHIITGTRKPSLEVLYKIADVLNVSVINLLLDEKEIERFYFDETIKAYYPSAEKLKELLGQIIDNNIMWDNTKRVAIIDLDDLKK